MNSPVDDTIQPYRFQPRRTLEESESSGEDESPNEDTDEELERLSFESRMGNTEWCKCGNCCPMTTAKESFCCQEFAHVRGKLSDSGGPQAANGHCPSCSCEVEMEAHCIVDHPDFYAVCLTKAVLDTALVGFHDVAHQAIPYPPPNREMVVLALLELLFARPCMSVGSMIEDGIPFLPKVLHISLACRY
eukprot:scpid90867/ scgid3655/ 